jgi:hypothetical protein
VNQELGKHQPNRGDVTNRYFRNANVDKFSQSLRSAARGLPTGEANANREAAVSSPPPGPRFFGSRKRIHERYLK